MSIFSIIDCTLRDGGYLNNWQFDDKFCIECINTLIKSNVDIVECGFLSEQSGNDIVGTNFKSIEKINNFLKQNNLNNASSRFALMLKPDEYDVQNLPKCDKAENVISIIRVMLYKNEVKESFDKLKHIIDKGYELHIQPTIISHYSDKEIIDMLELFKSLDYHSISIVDTFGALNEKEIERITILFDRYANKNSKLSIHCHNNLSLAYQNVIAFAETISPTRDAYIDASINSLGRGAGNLQTELLITWLKNEKNMKYLVSPIITFREEFISKLNKNISEKDFYAFSTTAKKNMHPNYAIWLILQKFNRLEVQKFLEAIPTDKYESFDFHYIKELCEKEPTNF